MNLVQRSGAFFEAVVLLGLGLFMFNLSGSDAYTQFMNPKFRWLTAATGVGLGVVGLNALFSLRRLPGMFRLGLFVLMALLIGLAMAEDPRAQAMSAEAELSPEARQPWLELEGKRYTKITTGELFILARKPKTRDKTLGQPFVMRGMVKRTPELDRMGLFALLRGNMICCAADAMAVGFYVQGADPTKFSDGEWARVYGEAVATDQKLPKPPRVDGIFYSLASKHALFTAQAIEDVPPPPSPYMFVIDAEQPYGY
jgi:hypothetical protein